MREKLAHLINILSDGFLRDLIAEKIYNYIPHNSNRISSLPKQIVIKRDIGNKILKEF